jgi:hypothetical protein
MEEHVSQSLQREHLRRNAGGKLSSPSLLRIQPPALAALLGQLRREFDEPDLPTDGFLELIHLLTVTEAAAARDLLPKRSSQTDLSLEPLRQLKREPAIP